MILPSRLRDMIPRDHEGRASTDHLRNIERMLFSYTFSQTDLALIEKAIRAERASLKRRADFLSGRNQ